MGEQQSGARSPKVWMLVDAGARQPAFEAVAEAAEREGAEVEIVSISEVIGTMAREAIAGGAERLLRGLRARRAGADGEEDLVGALRSARPAQLGRTNPRHARALGLLDSIAGVATLRVGLVAAFDVSAAWSKAGLDAIIVADKSDEDLDELVRAGARVLEAGPAVDPAWGAGALGRSEARDEHGFASGDRIALVRAASFEVSAIERLVFQCRMAGEARFLFHHDGDAAIAAELRRAAGDHGVKALMFGRVERLADYVALADLVVTSPHEPLLPELVASAAPLLLAGPGEAGRAAARRAGVEHVAEIARLGVAIERALGREREEEAEAEGAEDANGVVARAILEVWERRAELAPAAQGGEGDDEGGGGPFETIGEAPPRRAGDEAPLMPRGAAAKEKLAELILTERELERKLGELEREQSRWRERLEMAREWREEDLAEQAERALRELMRQGEPSREELDRIRAQKARLVEAARSERGPGQGPASPGISAEAEARFRNLEERRDLDALRDRVRRETGD